MFAIGPHLIDNPVFLAPMAGISDRPFRDLCARHGAGYAASEMISSDTLDAGKRLDISLEVNDPGQNARSFELDFREVKIAVN